MSAYDVTSELRRAARARQRASRQIRSTVADAVAQGVSQRKIAAELGISQPEVNRLLHSSSGRTASGETRTWMTARDARRAAVNELERGDELMAFKMIVQARDHLLSLRDEDDIAEWAVTPAPIKDERFDTLLRALTRRTFAAMGHQAPTWANPSPLVTPWAIHPFPSGRARAARDAPADLASVGLLITEADLVTA